ncbi:DUF1841 family protein [Cocleimonas sp. KMM 6892]|uniref:DUF1841 family protein n=1 Tax=unclassified Cocleimonas TaxID=2639732 RepID=UPI002DBE5004|nr:MULTISPECIES: DUF1841 family protein [unclassified Cocleimonas]MEB8432019.1 DUF1841 family protein [Cocleimonas sp. KMM 6892]MEC4714895.1 DUF1841 family protein [Cocleimonas sp. KMM 6895]MEC4744291.1 DUF1841 family protein [Cocleimonas sp. KMM 6896]
MSSDDASNTTSSDQYEQQREQLRQFYCDTWDKHLKQKQTLTDLEQQVTAVIKEHPEYHGLLENKEASVNAEYLPEMGENNPFLHMGMHLGIREQVTTNRPVGIAELYQRLVALKGVHDTEHEMMECLSEAMWQAQQNNIAPDENSYLDCLGKMEEKFRTNKG